MGVGGSKQAIRGVLGHEQINEYLQITYLNKFEIIDLFNRFCDVSPEEILHLQENFNHRVDFFQLMETFPIFKHNPFKDRICVVFSSEQDGRFSFEDLLDFYSVMSNECPHQVKALWAFRMFDFDEDGGIGEDDLVKMIDRLVGGYRNEFGRDINKDSKRKIAQKLMKTLDLEDNGRISELAFQHGIGKMMEFPAIFTVRV